MSEKMWETYEAPCFRVEKQTTMTFRIRADGKEKAKELLQRHVLKDYAVIQGPDGDLGVVNTEDFSVK